MPFSLLCAALLTAASGPSSAAEADVTIRKIVISTGVERHYVERGSGIPVVFIHGSLGDGGYWNPQVEAFAAAGYRAISYSRRYNPPNTNQPTPGAPPYSAITDAEDLAGLINALHLGKVHVVGHSYGALTALFLASKHPELIRAITLILSGENSYRFLGLIDEELAHLLPRSRRIVLKGATHRMWYEQPENCRNDVVDFLRQNK